MGLMLKVVRLLALMAACWLVPGTASAHHGHAGLVSIAAPAKTIKMNGEAVQADLKAWPLVIPGKPATDHNIPDCDCCPGPCAACGLLAPNLPTAFLPLLRAAALAMADPAPLAGLQPEGLRKPPRPFA